MSQPPIPEILNKDKSLLFSKTEIPDVFFTEYLPLANGDYVKETVKLESNGTIIYTEVFKVLHKKNSYVYESSIDMSARELAKPIAILKGIEEREVLQNYTKSEMINLIKFDIAELTNEELILYLKQFLTIFRLRKVIRKRIHRF